MAEFDQFANQGGPAHTPAEAAAARQLADEQLKNADYAGHLPEPLGSDGTASPTTGSTTESPSIEATSTTESTSTERAGARGSTEENPDRDDD